MSYYSFADLGTMNYEDVMSIQEDFWQRRVNEEIGDTLLLVEFNPVFSLGSGEEVSSNLLHEESWYKKEKNIEVVRSDRGGNASYHGPGHIYGCLIRRTDKPINHVRLCERILVSVANEHGVPARARTDEGSKYIGAWVDDRKLGFIAFSYFNMVTRHGFAINVDVDLEPFEWINPCGLTEKMTSLQEETGLEQDRELVKKQIIDAWSSEIGDEPEEIKI